MNMETMLLTTSPAPATATTAEPALRTSTTVVHATPMAITNPTPFVYSNNSSKYSIYNKWQKENDLHLRRIILNAIVHLLLERLHLALDNNEKWSCLFAYAQRLEYEMYSIAGSLDEYRDKMTLLPRYLYVASILFHQRFLMRKNLKPKKYSHPTKFSSSSSSSSSARLRHSSSLPTLLGQSSELQSTATNALTPRSALQCNNGKRKRGNENLNGLSTTAPLTTNFSSYKRLRYYSSSARKSRQSSPFSASSRKPLLSPQIRFNSSKFWNNANVGLATATDQTTKDVTNVTMNRISRIAIPISRSTISSYFFFASESNDLLEYICTFLTTFEILQVMSCNSLAKRIFPMFIHEISYSIDGLIHSPKCHTIFYLLQRFPNAKHLEIVYHEKLPAATSSPVSPTSGALNKMEEQSQHSQQLPDSVAIEETSKTKTPTLHRALTIEQSFAYLNENYGKYRAVDIQRIHISTLTSHVIDTCLISLGHALLLGYGKKIESLSFYTIFYEFSSLFSWNSEEVQNLRETSPNPNSAPAATASSSSTNNENIKNLSFSNAFYSLQLITKALCLGNVPFLRNLRFAGCCIGDYGVIEISDIFRSGRCPLLECLDLRCNYIGEKGIRALNDSIAYRLKYTPNSTSHSHTTATASIAPSLKLKYLLLGGNLLGDSSAVYLSQLLESNQLNNLEILSLDYNYLQQNGIISIIHSISTLKCPILRHLDFGGNNTQNAALHIAELVQKNRCPNLMLINAGNVSETGAKSIDHALNIRRQLIAEME